MDDRAIFAIKEYMCNLSEPAREWSTYEFSKRSYARWAISEILKRIQNQPNSIPIEVVKDFARKAYAYLGVKYGDRNNSFIFYVAHDVATDILDILRAAN